MNAKETIVRFRTTKEFKEQLENAAANLGLTMSTLIRKSVFAYIEKRAAAVSDAFSKRAARALKAAKGISGVELVDAVSKIAFRTPLGSMVTLADEEQIDADTFTKVILAKLEAAALADAAG